MSNGKPDCSVCEVTIESMAKSFSDLKDIEAQRKAFAELLSFKDSQFCMTDFNCLPMRRLYESNNSRRNVR